ncbi:MAG TPA: TetR family transcriptional regulator [Cellulomonas sp.]
MRIAATPDERPASDLTARARIRDAAIECFAEEGFGASFRTIAKRASVSPGLITHHFGSKEALRAECDAEVLRRYEALKTGSLLNPSAYLAEHLAEPGEAAQWLVYMLRAIHAGGQPARDFLGHFIDSARQVMKASVESGLVRPSRDEEARLRYLTYQTMGALLIQFLTTEDVTPAAFVESMQGRERDQILPILEMGTEGFLTSRSLLDDYLVRIGDPPGPIDSSQPTEQSA